MNAASVEGFAESSASYGEFFWGKDTQNIVPWGEQDDREKASCTSTWAFSRQQAAAAY